MTNVKNYLTRNLQPVRDEVNHMQNQNNENAGKQENDELTVLASACFFLDVDGTLIEIQDHWTDACSDEELQRILCGMLRLTDGAVALISGRRLTDIDSIFAPLTLCAAGQHGLERRARDGTI